MVRRESPRLGSKFEVDGRRRAHQTLHERVSLQAAHRRQHPAEVRPGNLLGEGGECRGDARVRDDREGCDDNLDGLHSVGILRVGSRRCSSLGHLHHRSVGVAELGVVPAPNGPDPVHSSPA